MNIVTLMPTRSRGIDAINAYRSYESTRLLSRSTMTFVLDYDDPAYDAYLALIDDKQLLVGVESETGNMVERTNKVALRYAASTPKAIIGWCADDNRFVTEGWDAKVLIEFDNPEVAIVVVNDGHWQGSKAGVVFMRAKVISALGWFALPTQEHLYIDDVWVKLGEASGGMVYLPDVVVEHQNPLLTGKGVLDAQGKHVNRPELYASDGAKYSAWLENGLQADAETVRACLRS